MEKRSFNHQIGTWVDTPRPKQPNPRQTGAPIRETASWIWRLHQKGGGKKRHRGSSASLPTKGRSQSKLRTSRSPRLAGPEGWRWQRRRRGRRTRGAMRSYSCGGYPEAGLPEVKSRARGFRVQGVVRAQLASSGLHFQNPSFFYENYNPSSSPHRLRHHLECKIRVNYEF